MLHKISKIPDAARRAALPCGLRVCGNPKRFSKRCLRFSFRRVFGGAKRRRAPVSMRAQVSDAPDGSLLVLYNTEETDVWQCRLSLFSPCGNETWQYVVSEYALDSGYGSAVDLFVSDSEITLDAYETREQTAYCEVILTWDGTVRRKRPSASRTICVSASTIFRCIP